VPTSPRQAALLDELLALFLDEGFRHLTLDELARRLSCSKSTLYSLAGSKEQLVVRVVRQFFAQATTRVEAEVAATDDTLERVGAYLRAVSAELAPASPAFFADLAAFAPAGEIYAHNTASAAQRVRELIDAGVAAGAVRGVHARFVGVAVSEVMTAIHAGTVPDRTGLDAATAYDHLADLVLHGIARPDNGLNGSRGDT
jgi:AcrR family transcriptional regulator